MEPESGLRKPMRMRKRYRFAHAAAAQDAERLPAIHRKAYVLENRPVAERHGTLTE